jgi:hypothetical protein
MRQRQPSLLEQIVRAQRSTIAALCERLDLVQRDAETALVALTEAEGRIADLEARVFTAHGSAGAYAQMITTWSPPEVNPHVQIGRESNQ